MRRQSDTRRSGARTHKAKRQQTRTDRQRHGAGSPGALRQPRIADVPCDADEKVSPPDKVQAAMPHRGCPSCYGSGKRPDWGIEPHAPALGKRLPDFIEEPTPDRQRPGRGATCYGVGATGQWRRTSTFPATLDPATSYIPGPFDIISMPSPHRIYTHTHTHTHTHTRTL